MLTSARVATQLQSCAHSCKSASSDTEVNDVKDDRDVCASNEGSIVKLAPPQQSTLHLAGLVLERELVLLGMLRRGGL